MSPTVTVDRWLERPPYGPGSLALLLLAFVLLAWSGQRVEVDKMLRQIGQAGAAAVGLAESSQVGAGLARVGESMWPPVIEERTETSRIADFDRAKLPWGARVEIEVKQDAKLDPQTLRMERREIRTEVLVEPFGYLKRVAWKMLETLEIALWATLLAVLVSAPLAYFGASNYAPNRMAYAAARGGVSFLRAMPELISALFLVLAFGFGAVPGILALGLHAAGFLGKFYAEDIENADRKPQEALAALGASKLKVLIAAVLPQVLPQYVAYTLYILDRNVRMATVIGIVGAGGIGQELKGRYDMFNYGHVTTILIAIFVTVFLLDQLSARIRRRLL
jgi:phosphonate transport system permease protein